MCEILEHEREVGKEIGKEIGKELGETLKSIKIIKKQLDKQNEISEIADLLDVENSFVLKVKEMMNQSPLLSSEEILGLLCTD